MSWTSLVLVTDQDLAQLEPETGDARLPLGKDDWESQRTEAKRDLKIWLELDFPDVPGVADRVLDRWAPDYVFGYTGSAYTDYTGQAKDDTPDDVPLATVFATPATDRLYIGAAWAFEGVELTLTGTRNDAASTVSVYYSGGTGWTAWASATDSTRATSTKSFSQSGRLGWTIPTGWQRQRLNGTGDEYYWIELRVSATLTAGVTAAQVLAVRPPDALKRCAAYLSLYHIYNGLAPGAANPEPWQAKADKYWDQAKSLYAALKNNSALWLDLNRDEAIAPEEATVRAPFRFSRG